MRSDLPLVVLLPHPDDEFAVMPFLRAAVMSGRALTLVWLTDGGAGRASASTRVDESLRALSDSGVHGATCRFLGVEHGLPDGALHRHLRLAKQGLDEVLDALPGALELWIPAWEGGHQDHDAAHALGCVIARERASTALQYPLYRSADRWGWTFTVLSPMPGASIAREARLSLREACALIAGCSAYRSQWRSFVGLLPVVAYRLLVRRRPMVLCRVDPVAPLDRPHAGVLLYERRTAWRWPDLRAAIEGMEPA